MAFSAQTALETEVEYQPNVVPLDVEYWIAANSRSKRASNITWPSQSIRKYFRNSWRRLPSNSRPGRGKKTETRECKVSSDS